MYLFENYFVYEFNNSCALKYFYHQLKRLTKSYKFKFTFELYIF